MRVQHVYLFSCCALLSNNLYSIGTSPSFQHTLLQETHPWFTGSLLATGTETTEAGHLYLFPLAKFTAFTGLYGRDGKVQSMDNFYSLGITAYSYFGICSFLDFGIAPQMLYQFTKGHRSSEVGDMPFGFDVQLLNNPTLMLSLGASAPFGKYNNLNPKKLYTDSIETGSWLPNISYQ